LEGIIITILDRITKINSTDYVRPEIQLFHFGMLKVLINEKYTTNDEILEIFKTKYYCEKGSFWNDNDAYALFHPYCVFHPHYNKLIFIGFRLNDKNHILKIGVGKLPIVDSERDNIRIEFYKEIIEFVDEKLS
jgi:hypothetical protein